ncbi:LPS assembly protein LptD [Roseomonas sp. E05]|uniref:LPS-assembly protein LptD n=1 Tax=Roseomonas sp. E05 TaxID=3046310 RepID=UPI0024BB5771|nr:LPS assembly protein LptD [Roseomonas sp. E05]MDJ0386849.1 LPS assembly protein LptD [Roseomonas sp. E05]
MDRAMRDAGASPAGNRKAGRWPRPCGWRTALLGSVALLSVVAPASRGVTQPAGGASAQPIAATPPATPPVQPAATPPAPGAAAPQQDGNNAPVTFTAESVEYDRERNLVTASGAVEAWQNERILRADRFTFDRNTGIATAEGHVQLLQPDGQVLFADRAELTGDLRDGVLDGLSARLAQNGRLVANGARRTGGSLLDLSRVLYSSCDLCAEDPTAPPLWELRARYATHDQEEKRLRYRDASLLLGGVPVLYTPYLSHPDPSAPRASGFLTPTLGTSSFLGGFVQTPYYWAIDPSQDLILSPTLSTKQDPGLGWAYRRRFNAGEISATGSFGQRDGAKDEEGWGAHIFSRGQFALDEHWRTGFNFNRASSEAYLRAWRYPSQRTLSSDIYAEGFWGAEGYARIDARGYQGLSEVDDTGQIPLVLPNLYSDYWWGRDRLGGYFTMDASAFALSRSEGTDTRRLASRLRYELPHVDRWGEIWTVRMQADGMGYWADDLDLAPNYASQGSVEDARGNVRLGLDWRLPMLRSAGEYGSQLIEPRVQVVTGPSMGRQTLIPNEDSLEFEFTDANLFELNRFPGRDRQEGGTRVDAALRGAWFFPNGGQLEGLVGRSYRASREEVFEEGSGLEDKASDWVGRVRLSPVPWLDLTARTRLDKDGLTPRLVETQGRVSFGRASVSASYLYTVPSAALTTQQERREVSGSVSGQVTRYWRAGAFGRYDLELNRAVAAGVSLTYEDECLIFDTRFARTYADPTSTSSYYTSDTVLLFRLSFKTVGDFGFRAI